MQVTLIFSEAMLINQLLHSLSAIYSIYCNALKKITQLVLAIETKM